jgi:hypothetical protein
MYAVVRTYSGNTKLADQLAARVGEIEATLAGVAGLRGYYLIRTDDGCTTVTVCDDQAGADETTRIAASWLRDHATEVEVTTPQVHGGEVLIGIGALAKA